MMNEINRFELEKRLAEKSSEAQAQAREIAGERKRLQQVNRRLQEVNVRWNGMEAHNQ